MLGFVSFSHVIRNLVPILIIIRECHAKCLGELVRAGCCLASAGNAFHTRDGIVNIHAFYQAGDAFGVAVTAADKFYVFDGVSVELNANELRADAGWSIIHVMILLCL